MTSLANPNTDAGTSNPSALKRDLSPRVNRLREFGHASPCAIWPQLPGWDLCLSRDKSVPKPKPHQRSVRRHRASAVRPLLRMATIKMDCERKFYPSPSLCQRGNPRCLPASGRHGSSASILPKQRQLNGAFAAYLARRWVPKAIRFYAWAVHSKAFHIRSCGWRGSSRRPAAIWTG
jgi:hypothetical protein